MWLDLPKDARDKYKKLITNFSSLSEAFAQKNDDKTSIVAPIVNSKFQESAFLYSFNANNEDYANTSFDASLSFKNKKYLVGIKSFGVSSGYQKIAQFKKAQKEWISLLNQIDENIKKIKKENKSLNTDSIKLKIYEENKDLYQTLTKEIIYLRNLRIASAKGQIKEFCGNDDNVESVYHILMTSKKNETPQIMVAETSYLPIDVNHIEFLGIASIHNPLNFIFKDSYHTYKYTHADSQLLMDFDNKNIIQEKWDVNYLTDPFCLFENLHDLIEKNDDIEDSVSWFIKLEKYSGFNAFNGSTKLAKGYRLSRIEKIQSKYPTIDHNIIELLRKYLLDDWRQNQSQLRAKEQIRDELMDLVNKENNQDLKQDIEKLVYRSATELYIPIPKSRQFHQSNPHFFGHNIGLLDKNNRLITDKEKRCFQLEFLPSGNKIVSYIDQDNGKAIQSKNNQDILGGWILYDIFQLKERELLTQKRLDELEINAIRLIKFKNKERGIGLKFIWIDRNNPPKDFLG